MKKFALIGSDISKSLSPKMWKMFGEKCGVSQSYELCELSPKATDSELLSAIAKYDGVNITTPFKARAAALLNLDVPINTVINTGGLCGYSLDGFGVVMALEQNGIEIGGKKLLVYGAGGAAESAISALVGEGALVSVINRTKTKADYLTKKYGLNKPFEKPFGVLSFVPEDAAYDLIEPMLGGAKFIFDANYKQKSPLAETAKKIGAKFIDGKSMLFYQGLAAFSVLTGTDDFDIDEMYGEFCKL